MFRLDSTAPILVFKYTLCSIMPFHISIGVVFNELGKLEIAVSFELIKNQVLGLSLKMSVDFTALILINTNYSKSGLIYL